MMMLISDCPRDYSAKRLSLNGHRHVCFNYLFSSVQEALAVRCMICSRWCHF